MGGEKERKGLQEGSETKNVCLGLTKRQGSIAGGCRVKDVEILYLETKIERPDSDGLDMSRCRGGTVNALVE